jgi:hypothetical protein
MNNLVLFLISGFAGILLYIVIDLLEFNRRTKEITEIKKVWKLYWTSINILKVVAGGLIVIIFSGFMCTEGREWMMKTFSAGQLDGSAKVEAYLFMFLVGLFWAVVIDKLGNIFQANPMQIKTTSEKTEENKQ